MLPRASNMMMFFAHMATILMLFCFPQVASSIHSPTTRVTKQSKPLSSLCTCQLPLNFNSFLSTGHLAFFPIALKLLFYNLFYQIVANERSTEKETHFPLALWYLSFASDFSFIRKRMNF